MRLTFISFEGMREVDQYFDGRQRSVQQRSAKRTVEARFACAPPQEADNGARAAQRPIHKV